MFGPDSFQLFINFFLLAGALGFLLDNKLFLLSVVADSE